MGAPLLALFVACTPDPVEAPPVPTWDDVAPALVRCAGCHTADGLTFPLTTWREVAPQALRVADVVASRAMPPWPAGPADVDYLDDPSLTEDEIARIAAWAEADAPLGAADPDLALLPVTPPALSRVDASLPMEAPWTPSGDEHRCFVLDRSAVVDPYVTGVEIVPGNLAVVHHLLLTAIVPTDPENDPRAADLADPAPGFDCSLVTLAAFPGASKVLGGWLPGRGPSIFPEGTGVSLDPAAELVLEAHYFAPLPEGPDQSTVLLTTAASVRSEAVEMKVTHPQWGLYQGVAAPAGERVTHKLKTTVAVESGGAVDLSNGVLAYFALPHMHALGVSISLEVVHAGVTTVLVEIPAWDYDWQLTYWFRQPYFLQADDELRLICVHDNPTSEDVWWGESTEDEMCVARVLIAPPSPALRKPQNVP